MIDLEDIRVRWRQTAPLLDERDRRLFAANEAMAHGYGGVMAVSAAIMGPAVSTFFNPQFSTPFSGEATPFVYLACLVAILVETYTQPAATGLRALHEAQCAREFPIRHLLHAGQGALAQKA